MTFERYVCPECGGSGIYSPHGSDGSEDTRCWYCQGTGLATDEDTVEHFYHYDEL